MCTRVIYDRELFNYEEYTSKCLSDDRLLGRLLFAASGNINVPSSSKIPPGKYLMGEFFKLQKQDVSASHEKLRSPNQLTAFLSHLASHVPKLAKITKKIGLKASRENITLHYHAN